MMDETIFHHFCDLAENNVQLSAKCPSVSKLVFQLSARKLDKMHDVMQQPIKSFQGKWGPKASTANCAPHCFWERIGTSVNGKSTMTFDACMRVALHHCMQDCSFIVLILKTAKEGIKDVRKQA